MQMLAAGSPLVSITMLRPKAIWTGHQPLLLQTGNHKYQFHASTILFPHKISVSELTNQCINNAI